MPPVKVRYEPFEGRVLLTRAVDTGVEMTGRRNSLNLRRIPS